MQIRNIMTNDVSTVTSDSTIDQAAQVMKNLNVGSVPVVEGNKPVGIVTDRDIAIRNVADNKGNNQLVKDIMTGNLVYGTPDMSAEEASNLMAENQIRRLPIVENGTLVGIVSLGDLAVQSRTDTEAGKALSNISTPSKPSR